MVQRKIFGKFIHQAFGTIETMRYAILLRYRPDGTYHASVPAIPGLAKTGLSRAETIAAMRQTLTNTLSSSEVVYLDLPTASAVSNPWIETAGLFADDPTLATMLEEIYANRDE